MQRVEKYRLSSVMKVTSLKLLWSFSSLPHLSSTEPCTLFSWAPVTLLISLSYLSPLCYPESMLRLSAHVLSHIWLWSPMDCSPPGSSVHGVSQARILEWVAIFYSRGSSQPRDPSHVSCISCIGRWDLHHWNTRKSHLYQHLLHIIFC